MEEQITAAAPLPYLRVSGSYREIGRQVGEEMRESIVAAIAFYAEHFVAWSGVAFAEAELLTAPRLEAARRHLPQCVEELAGMAEGAGVELAELLVLNCGEELWVGESCTSVAVANGTDTTTRIGSPPISTRTWCSTSRHPAEPACWPSRRCPICP